MATTKQNVKRAVKQFRAFRINRSFDITLDAADLTLAYRADIARKLVAAAAVERSIDREVRADV